MRIDTNKHQLWTFFYDGEGYILVLMQSVVYLLKDVGFGNVEVKAEVSRAHFSSTGVDMTDAYAMFILLYHNYRKD
jgi:hypothetical protein